MMRRILVLLLLLATPALAVPPVKVEELWICEDAANGDSCVKLVPPASMAADRTCNLQDDATPLDSSTCVAASGGTSTRQFTFVLGADNGAVLVDGDDQPDIWPNDLGGGITITQVKCYSDAGTPSINLQRDDGTAANILSSNLSCSTSGATGTIDVAEDNVADGQKIDFAMVAAGGTAKRATVTVRYTVD